LTKKNFGGKEMIMLDHQNTTEKLRGLSAPHCVTHRLYTSSQVALSRPFFDLVEATSWFIQSLCPWDWYFTLTFHDAVHPEQADKRFYRWVRGINIERYGKRFREKHLSVPWVRATEYQKRGVLHYHGLMGGGVSRLRRLTWMDYWEKGFPLRSEQKSSYRGPTQLFSGGNGFARILPYNPRKGARYYLSKYLLKGGEIDFSVPTDAVTSWVDLST
jgi:hypothetical protein